MNKKKLFVVISIFLYLKINCIAQVPIIAEVPTVEALLGYIKSSQLGQYLAVIDQLYTDYDKVMNQITMIENQYNTLKFWIERAASFRFDEIEWDGDLDFRDEIQQVTSQVDRELTNIRKIRDTFTKATIDMNGHSYSLAALCGFSEDGSEYGMSFANFIADAIDDTKDSMAQIRKEIEEGITEEEAVQLWAKYGLSPENYYMLKAVENKASGVIQEALAWEDIEAVDAAYEQSRTTFKNLDNQLRAKAAEGNLTEVEVGQALFMAASQLASNVNDFITAMKRGFSSVAWSFQMEKSREEAKEKSENDMLSRMTPIISIPLDF